MRRDVRSPRWQGNSRAQAAASLALKLKALLSVLASHSGGEACVCDLSAGIELSQPTISHHLEVLRTAGLVDVRRDAQRRLYRLRPEPLMEVDEWLEPFRAHWSGQLDSLERHLRRTATPVHPATRTQKEQQ